MDNPRRLIVQKFGGSSLATPQRIKEVAKRVVDEKKLGKDVIVVVSAMGDTTDELFRLAKKISPNPPKRELDMLLTAGERISMALLSMAINELGFQSISFTGSQSGIVTDTRHTRAKILDVRAYRVKDELEKGKIVIVAGFQGVSPSKEVTTLGRGGSDTTCVALAAAFRAEECEIFTDVDGVYTADPRIVPQARKIDKISYDEMLELSFCGAQVLHSRSVDVARRFGVRVHVRSSFGKERGTMVTESDEIEATDIRGIAQDTDVFSIALETKEVSRTASEIMGILEENDINLKFVSISPESHGLEKLVILISRQDRELASQVLKSQAPELELSFDDDVATVSVVGHGLCTTPGITRKILETLSSLGVEPKLVTTSGITLTLAVRRNQAENVVRKLHEDLGLSSPTRSVEQR